MKKEYVDSDGRIQLTIWDEAKIPILRYARENGVKTKEVTYRVTFRQWLKELGERFGSSIIKTRADGDISLWVADPLPSTSKNIKTEF